MANQTNQDFTYGKTWTGAGADALASNPDNWSGNLVPVSSDIVRFDSTNPTKTCVWNLSYYVQAIQIKVDYSSSVVAASNIMVGTVTIENGEFLFGSFEMELFRNFNHSGGRFRFAADGNVILRGTTTQNVSMVKTDLGGGLYDSYFAKFRVQSSSTVRVNTGLVIDETFNISMGRFEAMHATHTMTAGLQNGVVGPFNWDDTGGVLAPGSGAFEFRSAAGGSYQISQGASNAFFNFIGAGATALTFTSNVTINGSLVLGGSGSTVNLNAGSGFVHTIAGPAAIGPASPVGSPTLSLGASTITFQSGVAVGTATLSVQGGRVQVQSSSLTVTGQGTVTVPSGQTGRFVFWEGTNLHLHRGTLAIPGSGVFISSAPGVTRFSTDLNGTINISGSATFNSMDVNGMRMGLGAVPTNLSHIDFLNGATGSAAINFSPVTQANVTVDFPSFDVSFSTNVRAILDTAILLDADIDVVRSTGSRNGPVYEHDPSGIVNWGTLGTPTGFAGTTLGASSITWSWATVNHPYGFVVVSSTGGVLSSTLTFSATTWTETGLSTNTQYTRLVRAFTDVAQVDSSSLARYSAALPATTLTFPAVSISSLTLTWLANTNPAPTVFLVDRSTNDVVYANIASGTIAALSPYTDTGLSPNRLYYYRVRTMNGDSVVVSSSVKSSTTTLPIPPPAAYGIAPSTISNLGVVSFTISGAQIQSGATVRLKRSSSQVLTPSVSAVSGPTAMTATFNMTGSTATTWDVEIENPDGQISIGTGDDLLLVTDAISAAPITIQAYASASALSFNTLGNETTITMAAGAMANGRLYVSVDPINSPLTISPAAITAANTALTGWILVPGSIREILAFTSAGPFTSGFSGAVTLAITYPDADNNGVVDSIALRASTLQLMTLNETTSRWQVVTNDAVDTTNHRVGASVSHFSVYAVFGSPGAETLAEAKAYPSPWTPGSLDRFDAANLTVTNLTASGAVRIYTLGAELVKTLLYAPSDAGLLLWDGKGDDGSLVKSGVYLIAIESSAGESKILKVGIER